MKQLKLKLQKRGLLTAGRMTSWPDSGVGMQVVPKASRGWLCGKCGREQPPESVPAPSTAAVRPLERGENACGLVDHNIALTQQHLSEDCGPAVDALGFRVVGF